jgi:hypothetical protein
LHRQWSAFHQNSLLGVLFWICCRSYPLLKHTKNSTPTNAMNKKELISKNNTRTTVMKKQELLVQCFEDVSDDARVRNKWISTQTWESMIRQRFNFGDHYEFRISDLSRAIQSTANRSITHLHKISHSYHYDNENANLHFFLVVDPKQTTPAKGPPKDNAKSYWESRLKEQNCILEKMTRTTPRPCKTQKTDNAVVNFLLQKVSEHQAKTAALSLVTNLDHWKSPRTIELFNPIPGEDVKETLARRIKKLQVFVNHPSETNVATVVENYDEMPNLSLLQGS